MPVQLPYMSICTGRQTYQINWQLIGSDVNCQTKNVVYCITCSKCKEQYIGETEKTLALRTNQHRGYIRNNKVDKATGEHFNKPGHQLADMKISIVEKVKSNDPMMLEVRESHFIKKFQTKYKGMNRKI